MYCSLLICCPTYESCIETNLEALYLFQEELRDAKEQLNMYEAALDSSTKGPISSTPLNAPRVEMKWPSHEYVKTPLSRLSFNVTN